MSDSAFVIERGVPLPPRSSNRAAIYPFGDMAVGESFLVPCSPPEVDKVRRRITAAAHDWRRRSGAEARFETRAVEGGVRAWRRS